MNCLSWRHWDNRQLRKSNVFVSLSASPSSLGSADHNFLLHHPAVQYLSSSLRPRSRLKPRHQALFDDEDDMSALPASANHFTAEVSFESTQQERCIFNQLGRLCCQTGVVSRKEFLETYSAASVIHKHMFGGRVADIAAGHGLLAWFLLVMQHEYANNGKSGGFSPRTAVCIDQSMPQAAQKIAAVCRDSLPHSVASQFTYVQADLRNCQPDASCLLASVHACGSLTDDIIDMAIQHGAPCAVVPCCHTVRPELYRPHVLANESVASIAQRVQDYKDTLQNDDKHMAVGTVVDDVRVRTLQRAGFSVQQIELPAAFTARNRLILAQPPSIKSTSAVSLKTNKHSTFHTPSRVFFERTPPAHQLIVPLADDLLSIEFCRRISGPQQAQKRLVKQIPRHFSLTLAFSLWLDHDTLDTSPTRSSSPLRLTLSLPELQHLVDQTCLGTDKGTPSLQCTVTAAPMTSWKGLRQSQLYKFCYTRRDGGSMSGAPRHQAKSLHSTLRRRIANDYGLEIFRRL